MEEPHLPDLVTTSIGDNEHEYYKVYVLVS